MRKLVIPRHTKDHGGQRSSPGPHVAMSQVRLCAANMASRATTTVSHLPLMTGESLSENYGVGNEEYVQLKVPPTHN